MSENKQKVIIALLVVNAVLILYFGVSINNNLQADQQQLANQISNLNHSISNLDGSIAGRIQSVLDQRDDMIAAADYDYVEIDAAANKALVDVTVQLKAIRANSKIFLACRERDADEVQEIELAKKDGLSFAAEVELKLDKNYQYDILERMDSGEETLLNMSQRFISPYDEFFRNRVMMDGFGSGRSNEQIDFDCLFSVDDFGIDEFALDQVMLEVHYEGQVIDRIDITDKLSSFAIAGLREEYLVAIASGQIDSGIELEEFYKKYEYGGEEKNGTRTFYSYVHVIDYDTHYPELALNVQKADRLYVNLVVVCKDGYQTDFS